MPTFGKILAAFRDCLTVDIVKTAYEHQAPVCMRFCRYAAPVFQDVTSFQFEIGKGEVLRDGLAYPVGRVGVNDEFGHSGPAVALLKQFGLCREQIVETAQKMCPSL